MGFAVCFLVIAGKQWQLDENGVKRVFAGRNREQRDVLHDTHLDMAALAANGLSAVPLTAEQFEPWLQSHAYTFANFVRWKIA